MCGYETGYEWEEDKFECDADFKCKDIKVNDYESIDDIDYETFKSIDGYIKNGDADEDMKKQHKKFIFDEYILCNNDEIEMCYKKDMFDTYTTNGNKINESRKNMNYELKYEYNNDMKIIVSHYKDNLKEKLENLKVIKQLLGIKYSFDKGEVNREKIKKMGDYLKKNLQNVKEIWGLDLREIKKTDKKDTYKMSDKATLGVLNQIWARWGFNEIKMMERKKKQIKGVRVDVSGFSMQPFEKYSLFDYCFDKTEYTEENEDEMG
jgi:hypothetical protein